MAKTTLITLTNMSFSGGKGVLHIPGPEPDGKAVIHDTDVNGLDYVVKADILGEIDVKRVNIVDREVKRKPRRYFSGWRPS